MKISVALATFNGAKYLQDQLASFLDQERMPDELVVCDDDSSDDTVLILESFIETASFQVKLVQNKSNLGYTKNFEKALFLCSGDIIFFSDQDDVWFPSKIKVIEKKFRENPDISLIIHDGELVDHNLGSTGVTKLGQIRSGGYADDSFVTGALSAVRSDILNIILPFPEGISGGHDGWVHTIARLVDRRMIVDNILQKLRRHSNNTSDWVASSSKEINRIDVLVSQFSTTAAKSYADRLLISDSIIQRLDTVEPMLFPYPFDQQKIRQYLNDERAAILNREKLIIRNFFGRKLSAIAMLFNGNYSHFNGVKSFVRDFLRFNRA